jgi:uncharacterized protein YcfL
MFTIDLQKGAGLPPKNRPLIVALAMVPFVIPLLGTVVMAACWMHNKTLITTQQKVIQENRQKISGLKNDLLRYKQTTGQIEYANQQFGDIAETLQCRIQYTPFLVGLVENLPESLVISKLDMDRTDQRKTQTDPKTGNTKEIVVVQRKLRMVVSGPATDGTDNAVKQYVQKLSGSPVLMKEVIDVRVTSRNNNTVNGQNYALYEIECAMKDQV